METEKPPANLSLQPSASKQYLPAQPLTVFERHFILRTCSISRQQHLLHLFNYDLFSCSHQGCFLWPGLFHLPPAGCACRGRHLRHQRIFLDECRQSCAMPFHQFNDSSSNEQRRRSRPWIRKYLSSWWLSSRRNYLARCSSIPHSTVCLRK